MSSDTSTTATGRLAAMCTQFNSVSGSVPLAAAWGQYLSVPPSDTHSLMRGVQGVGFVIKESRAECESLKPRHRDQLIPIWTNLELLVDIRHWDAAWLSKSHLAATPADVLLLSAHHNLTPVDPTPWVDETRTLRDMIIALTVQVSEAKTIDDRLRSVLLKLLSQAQFALAQYESLGGQAMVDAMLDTRWTFVAEHDVLRRHADNPLVAQSVDAVAQTETLADRISRNDPIVRLVGVAAMFVATLTGPSLAELVKTKLNPPSVVQPALPSPKRPRPALPSPPTVVPDEIEEAAPQTPGVFGLLERGKEPHA